MNKRTTFLALALAAVMSLGLFMVSYQVQDLEDQLDTLNRDIARDNRAVHVLQAEWAHLNDPQRLRLLAERYLGLEPIATKQLGTVEEIPWRPVIEVADRAGKPGAAASSAPTPVVSAGDKAVEDALPAIRRALGLTPTPVKEGGR
ncbi:MAG: hypothetical protein CMM77_13795 [Rhodospirillaceae bacterium]|nr:hypothetical protein [Magnetovibrio sp.]MAY68183.1 hypothetical protein [Rhodospirillaceae bacterium]